MSDFNGQEHLLKVNYKDTLKQAYANLVGYHSNHKGKHIL